MICILLTSTITQLAVALVWSVQLESEMVCGNWASGFFPNFKQEFLLNGKRVKCYGETLARLGG